jgi:hypothetical protein
MTLPMRSAAQAATLDVGARKVRILLAIGFVLVTFALLTVLGGLGPMLPAGTASAAEYEYGKKVTICHRTGSEANPLATILVNENALDQHLGHGDTLGPCPG